MIQTFIKLFAMLALLFTSTLAFAEDEDPGMGMEDSEGNISEMGLEEEAPMDSNLLYLALGALTFGYCYFYKAKTHSEYPD